MPPPGTPTRMILLRKPMAGQAFALNCSQNHPPPACKVCTCSGIFRVQSQSLALPQRQRPRTSILRLLLDAQDAIGGTFEAFVQALPHVEVKIQVMSPPTNKCPLSAGERPTLHMICRAWIWAHATHGRCAKARCCGPMAEV